MIYLFSHLARRNFGLQVEKVRAGFPDCIAYRQGKPIRIEFEYRSRNFCITDIARANATGLCAGFTTGRVFRHGSGAWICGKTTASASTYGFSLPEATTPMNSVVFTTMNSGASPLKPWRVICCSSIGRGRKAASKICSEWQGPSGGGGAGGWERAKNGKKDYSCW